MDLSSWIDQTRVVSYELRVTSLKIKLRVVRETVS